MVRKYRPDVIIDNRLEGSGEKNGSIATKKPLSYSGDFASPEQVLPPRGLYDELGEPISWELCATMNNHWGYCSFDHTYKEPEMIIRKLVECVSKGGNMLMNVGPDAGRLTKGGKPPVFLQKRMDKGKPVCYDKGLPVDKAGGARYEQGNRGKQFCRAGPSASPSRRAGRGRHGLQYL